MDLTHKMLEVALGKIYRAPVKNPRRVLDAGTGTGIWALEFGKSHPKAILQDLSSWANDILADQHPQADILGNDLSPVQPRW